MALYEDWDRGVERILAVVQPMAAVVHEVERKLRSRSARERIAAADRLAEMGRSAARSAPCLIELLQDENGTVRRAAVGALERIDGPTDRTVKALLRLVNEEKWPRESFYDEQAAMSTLSGFGASGLDSLLNTLARDPSYVDAVGRVLSGMSDVSAAPRLLTLLTDERDTIRGGAAVGLGRIFLDVRHTAELQSLSVVPALILRLKDQSGLVRADAARALGMVGHRPSKLHESSRCPFTIVRKPFAQKRRVPLPGPVVSSPKRSQF